MHEIVDLDDEEERVYLVLLDHGHLPVSRIPGRCDVPDGLEVVKRLCAKGFATIVGDVCTAIDPAVALRDGMSELEHRLFAVRKKREELTRRFHARGATSVPTEMVEYWPNGPEAVVRLNEELDAAVSDISALSAGHWTRGGVPGVSRKGADSERDAINRGVDVRVIYDRRSVDQPGRLEDLLYSAELGERSRVLPDLPFLGFVIDRRMAFLPLGLRYVDSGGLLIRSGPLLTALLDWYECLWEKAIPLDALSGAKAPNESRDESTDFTGEEHRLLGLLASGLTDGAIGRQLGVSERTAQRKVAAILERLGARTRFQAGLQAARTGLF